MTFQDAQQRLLAYVRDRIHNGEFTERGFARMIGISQPHAHNVLKGVRNLSIEVSDSILNLFHVSILDLASTSELEGSLKRRTAGEPPVELPFLSTPIGPGTTWQGLVDWGDRFPGPFPGTGVPAGFVMARLVADPQMSVTLAQYDVAILDVSLQVRSQISPTDLYVVEHAEEALLRYVRPGSRGFYLVTEANMNQPHRWERLDTKPNEPAVFIKARVSWLGRSSDRDLPVSQRGRFL